jgi:hypothetical protein
MTNATTASLTSCPETSIQYGSSLFSNHRIRLKHASSRMFDSRQGHHAFSRRGGTGSSVHANPLRKRVKGRVQVSIVVVVVVVVLVKTSSSTRIQ